MAETVTVTVCDDSTQAAFLAAELVAEAALQAVAERGRFLLALAGGSTPRMLYEILAAPEDADGARDEIEWERVHVFWSDERHVPPDHPDSNYRMACEALLDQVPVPAAQVHRVLTEWPADRAAAACEADVRNVLGPREPVFDLILLGLGTDAHTASLFPGSPLVHETDRLVAAAWVETHGAWRITFTPALINAARQVTFVVCGAEKAAAVAAVLEGSAPALEHPARAIRPTRGTVTWVLDRAAASRLARRT